MSKRFFTSVLLAWTVLLMTGGTAHAVHPVVRYVGEYLGKTAIGYAQDKLIDYVYDSVTGKPNIPVLNERLKKLERNAAVHPLMQAEIKALRESVNERTTRAEFRKLAETTVAKISSLEARMYDAEQRIEKLEVENGDLKHGTANAKNEKFFIRKAKIYEAKMEFHKAIAAYSIAIDLAKTDPEMYRNRAEVFLRIHADGAAMIDATDAIRLNSKNAGYYYLRGLANAGIQSDSSAVSDFSASLRLQPNQANAYYSRSVIQARLNRMNSAKADLSRALSLDTNLTWFLYPDNKFKSYSSTRTKELLKSKLVQNLKESERDFVQYALGNRGADYPAIRHLSGDQPRDGSLSILKTERVESATDIQRHCLKNVSYAKFAYEPVKIGPYIMYRPYDAEFRQAEMMARKNKLLTFEQAMRGVSEKKPYVKAFCFLDSKTLLSGQTGTVTEVLSRYTPPGRNPALFNALQKLDTTATIAMVFAGSPSNVQTATGKPPTIPGVDFDLLSREIRSGNLEINVTDTIKMKLTLFTSDAKYAKDFTTQLERYLKFLATASADLPKKLPEGWVKKLRNPGLTYSGNTIGRRQLVFRFSDN